MNPYIIFDTNTIVSALFFPNSVPRKAFDKGLLHFQIIFSPDTWLELNEVLHRKKFDKYLNPSERTLFLEILQSKSLFFEPTILLEKICRDSKDDKFLHLAIFTHATLIISGDEDLLVLNPFKNIQILKPANFLISNT